MLLNSNYRVTQFANVVFFRLISAAGIFSPWRADNNPFQSFTFISQHSSSLSQSYYSTSDQVGQRIRSRLNNNQSLQLTVFATASIEEREGLLFLFKLRLTTHAKTNSGDCLTASLRDNSPAFLAVS
jgi:hypothetical protein